MALFGQQSQISTRRLALLALITAFCVLSLLPSVECIFKMVKKKKFMEGFLVGFLVGNEYAAHKSPAPHKPPDYYGSMSGLGGMGMAGGMMPSYMADSPMYMPKKRSFRITKPKFTLRRRSNQLLQLHQQQQQQSQSQSARSLGSSSSRAARVRRGRVKKSSSRHLQHFPSSASQISLSPSSPSSSSSTIKFPVYIRKSST